jgi:hypothetical protein
MANRVQHDLIMTGDQPGTVLGRPVQQQLE